MFSLVINEGTESLVAIIDGEVFVATDAHPQWATIRETALAGEELTEDLFRLDMIAGQKFDGLSDRVSVSGGTVYLDGDPVHSSLTDQIVRFISEGVEDWKPLVRFFEKVQSNPNEHSREQLYDWLARRDFTITPDGDFIAYKGVENAPDGGLQSIHTGHAIVNGEVVRGKIPNPLGGIIEMPRADVTHDPSQGCHTGLHVGTYEYANAFARGALLEVIVNPRDVVSVPSDSQYQKMRVCRYRITKLIDAPHTVPVLLDYEDDEFDDPDMDYYPEEHDYDYGFDF
jgi:hypothetical protein